MAGLIFGGKFAFQNRLGWLIDGSKFTVFALFYFVFEDNFPSTSPRGAYIWRGDLTEGFLGYRFGGLIFGEGFLFSEFYGILVKKKYWFPFQTLNQEPLLERPWEFSLIHTTRRR